MKKNLLICGATGFIGKNLLIYYSKKKKFNIFATYNKTKPFSLKGIKWIKSDLRISKNVAEVTKNKDIVIQAAATTTGSKDVINQPYVHVTDNTVMNAFLFRSCYENKVKHVIFFSCTTMYKSSKKPIVETNFDPRKDIEPKYFGVATTKVYRVMDMKTASKINFKCEVTLSDGIKKKIDWYLKNINYSDKKYNSFTEVISKN